MIVRVASAAFLFALATAPYQCKSDPPPGRLIEEDPSEVLYQLAEKFRTEGQKGARASTLRYLAERYPTSRFAKIARAELSEMGEPAPPAPAE